MTIGWVIFGVVAQAMLGFFSFMLCVFAGGGTANGGKLTDFQLNLLTLSIYLIPATSALSIIALIFFYRNGADSIHYWWHAPPVVLIMLYFFYVLKLSK